MSESGWHDCGPVDELTFDPGACVTVEGREVAVFRLDDGLHAVENSCPHAGGELADGCLENGVIACNWHGWRFDVRTGGCVSVPTLSVMTHRVRIADGRLHVQLGKT